MQNGSYRLIKDKVVIRIKDSSVRNPQGNAFEQPFPPGS